METNPDVATASTTPKHPRWLRKRYGFLAIALLTVLAMSPTIAAWYRRHQMIQQLLGGYGREYSVFDVPPFSLVEKTWPRRFLGSYCITPFDRLCSARLELEHSSDLRLIANEHELERLTFYFPMPKGGDDSAFDALASLSALQELNIGGVSLQGDGLKHIKNCRI